MSASNEWTEWHLTPNGWVRGSERVDFGNITEVTPPEDRVFSQKYNEFMSSGFSKMDKFLSNPHFQTNEQQTIDKLIEKFGACPNNL